MARTLREDMENFAGTQVAHLLFRFKRTQNTLRPTQSFCAFLNLRHVRVSLLIATSRVKQQSGHVTREQSSADPDFGERKPGLAWHSAQLDVHHSFNYPKRKRSSQLQTIHTCSPWT